MMAAPRLLAGLMPVLVIGMVAKWTKNTANPIGRGAKIGTCESLAFSLAPVAKENGVDKDKGAHYLSTKPSKLGVARSHNIDSTTPRLKVMYLEPLHHTCATDGTQALHDHVEYGSG